MTCLNAVSAIFHHKRFLLLCLLLTAFLAVAVPVLTEERFFIDSSTLNMVEKQYGKEARLRLVAWQELILRNRMAKEMEKLELVNLFFNRMEFVSDIQHWHKDDYWATPTEFLAANAGDCEDFALAKYFTLRSMGVRESHLNLTYVKALRLNQHHMVLTYYPTPGSVPLVLDNLTDTIEEATRRTDLLPIYSFNGSSLWLAKQRGRGRLVGSSDKLSRWQDLLQRMAEGLIESNHHAFSKNGS